MSDANTTHPAPIRFIIITGMSGAGKALATAHFEDFGFFCVDNLPPALLPQFAELCDRGGIGRIAIVVDVRGGEFFGDLSSALDKVRAHGIRPQILFLDADDELLMRRFNETRRRHPLGEHHPDLQSAIDAERQALTELRAQADKIVNTSQIAPRELREELRKTFLDEPETPQMLIRVQSFGFKHGVPQDADMVFDLRFLANPNYDRVIGHLDGHHAPVIDYVMRESVTQEFLSRLGDLIDFCVPQFEREGKNYLTIAVGCTGGRHRSVVIANWLADKLRQRDNRVNVVHRDLSRSAGEARARVTASDSMAIDHPDHQKPGNSGGARQIDSLTTARAHTDSATEASE